jgi:PelA/Pel-15E family pectate lyase
MNAAKLIIWFLFVAVSAKNGFAQDSVADNMLLYQRAVGGWPKHIGEQRIDYKKSLSPAEKAGLVDDRNRNDATIDNNATTKEIRYLVKAYKQTGNAAYLAAAENGISYLLKMQYANGGFPQFYPDTSLYRSEITYNDNAMINALEVLWDVAHPKNGFEVIGERFAGPAQTAVERGVTCILNTQIRRGGKLTAWCAQYDKTTLEPANARSFELASLSGDETVAIVEFLMKIDHPSEAVIQSIDAAVQWLQSSKIEGYAYVDINDPSQPNGRDRVIRPDASSTIWARFYDIDTNRPFFCGRDGIKKWNVAEIENERRTGYGWYGTWPQQLLQKDFPEWKMKNKL